MNDILLHSFKEKEIFDLAKQPFSPINIANFIQSMTGITPKYELTSICILDTDVTPLMFKLDENALEINIDSMADKLVTFESQGLTKGLIPQFTLKSPRVINSKIQTPYIRDWAGADFRKLLDKMDSAQIQHQTKSEFKLDEDPWDNYLYYDSKTLVKLICH